MKLRMTSVSLQRYWLGILALAFVAIARPVAAEMVEEVNAKRSENGYTLTVRFSAPLQYQSHTPVGATTLLTVLMRPDNLSQDFSALQDGGNQTLTWDQNLTAGLQALSYDAGQQAVIAQFATPVTVKVRGSSDRRELIINVESTSHSESTQNTLGNLNNLVTILATTDPKLADTLAEANKAFIDQNYRRAVQLYTKVRTNAEGYVAQRSQEMIALCRELNGQVAQAKAEYEAYLADYGNTADAERVQQRLTAMLSAAQPPRQRLRAVKQISQPQQDGWQSQLYGGFAQNYFRDQLIPDQGDSLLVRSDITTDFDLVAKTQKDDLMFKAQVVGSYREDLLDDDGQTRFLPSIFTFEAEHKGWGLYTKVGRQSLSSGGVLGRFDGAHAAWQINDTFAVNAVAGYPVRAGTRSTINTDIQFQGLNVDINQLLNNTDINVYYLRQDNNGLADREAVGGEIRYRNDSLSVFSMLDYDILFSEVNLFVLIGHWQMNDKTAFNLSADYRNSPLLTTNNALIGQGVERLSDLTALYTEDELMQLARDRTASSQSFTLGLTRTLNARWQLMADMTLSKYGDTVTSGGVEGFAGTDNEYQYSVQFVGNQLVQEYDTLIAGFRYADTTRSSTYSTNASWRFRLGDHLRLNPRLRVDYRTGNTADDKRTIVRPFVRLEYQYERWLRLETDFGYEWFKQTLADVSTTTKGYFISIGYRASF